MEHKSRLPKKFRYYLKREEFNVLFPSEKIYEISDVFKLVPEIVTVDTNLAAGDIWELGEQVDEHGQKQLIYALTNRALQRIAQAAEITFDPRYTHRTDDGKNPRRVEYQATGMLRKSDGQWMTITQSKELDLDVIELETRNELEAEAARGELKVTRNGIEQTLGQGTPECTKEIAHRVSAKMLMWQKNKLAFAITGAYKRVIRSLLLIKDFYTIQELEKPFVVPRVSLDTDLLLSEVELRKHFANAFLDTSVNMYGPPAGLRLNDQMMPSAIALSVRKRVKLRGRQDDKNVDRLPGEERDEIGDDL